MNKLFDENRQLRAELEQERDIRESRETTIELVARELAVSHEPHQTFTDRLIDAARTASKAAQGKTNTLNGALVDDVLSFCTSRGLYCDSLNGAVGSVINRALTIERLIESPNSAMQAAGWELLDSDKLPLQSLALPPNLPEQVWKAMASKALTNSDKE